MIGWVDIETTGLDPETDEILELGLVLTWDDLTEAARHSWVVMPEEEHEPLSMHVESGLWEEAVTPGKFLQGALEVERDAMTWLGNARLHADDCADEPEAMVMAGSTVHFDHAFLKRHMPKLERTFHYRNLDVSSFKELNARIPFAPAWEVKGPKPHRALADLDASIAELRHYVRWMHATPGTLKAVLS